jgi:AcrR family transcriptional regulator
MAAADHSQDEVKQTISLLWSGPRVRTRGPQPLHGLGDVVEAAISIADAEGIAAVSMQRLAEELGFTKMALYRYVPSRMALVALMTDRAMGPPPAAKNGDWRARLESWTLAIYKGLAKHPWCVTTTTGPRIFGPNEAGWTEAGLAILAPAGLRPAEQLDTLALLAGHARAMAQQLGPAGQSTEAAIGGGLVQALAGTDKASFPHLRGVLASMTGAEADGALGFGIGCILDGLTGRIAKDGSSLRRSKQRRV